MKINRETLEKIKNQITRDEKMFKHKMFGEFELSFKESVTTLMFGLITCAPTIFSKLDKIFDPKTPNQPMFSHKH